MKRILTILLALVMVATICVFAASCGGETTPETKATTKTETTTNKGENDQPVVPGGETTNGGDTNTETTSGGDVVTTDGGKESETTAGTTPGNDFDSWDGKTKMPGKASVDFGGKTFLIASSTQDQAGDFNNASEIWVESLTNDAINDAVFERNQVMSQLYNCTIAVDDGGWENGFNADVSAGGGKYIIGCAEYNWGTSGAYYNLLNLDIDWTQSWWDQNLIRDMSVNNKLYAITGDFGFHNFVTTWIIMYNKDVYDQNLASSYDIYQLVRDNKWTIDMMLTMSQSVLSDGNGDQAYTTDDSGDILGTLSTVQDPRAMYWGCGERIVDKDENGKLICALASTGRGSDVFDKIRELTTDDSFLEVGYTTVQKALQGGTTLFGTEVMDVLRRMSDQEGIRVGVVPHPLFNEQQERYYSYVNNQCPLYLVPTSYKNMQEIADFFTLFAAHSSKIVRPAFINTYKYSYVSDEESSEMIELILDTRIFDPCYHYGVGSSFEGLIGTMLSKTGKNQFASAVRKCTSQVEDAINNLEIKVNAIDDPV